MLYLFKQHILRRVFSSPRLVHEFGIFFRLFVIWPFHAICLAKIEFNLHVTPQVEEEVVVVAVCQFSMFIFSFFWYCNKLINGSNEYYVVVEPLEEITFSVRHTILNASQTHHTAKDFEMFVFHHSSYFSGLLIWLRHYSFLSVAETLFLFF